MQKRFYILVAFLFSACGGPSGLSPQQPQVGNSGNSTRNVLGETLSLDVVDSMALKVTGARAGLQTYFSYNSPVVTLFIPKKSNYVEILRCAEHLKIANAIDGLELRTLDLSYGFDAQQSLYKKTDYWSTALGAGCETVTSGLADEIFFDSAAPDGSSFYILRACVLGERMKGYIETENAGPICSRILATTSSLRYVNERTIAQKNKLASAQSLADKAFGITRQATSVAAKLDVALAECQSESEARSQKKSIFDWLQLGFGWVKTIFPALAVPFDIVKAGDALGQLKNLFGAGQPNLPQSCQLAIDLQTSGKALVTEIETLQKLYFEVYSQVSKSSSPTLNLEDAYDETIKIGR